MSFGWRLYEQSLPCRRDMRHQSHKWFVHLQLCLGIQRNRLLRRYRWMRTRWVTFAHVSSFKSHEMFLYLIWSKFCNRRKFICKAVDFWKTVDTIVLDKIYLVVWNFSQNQLTLTHRFCKASSSTRRPKTIEIVIFITILGNRCFPNECVERA